MGKPKLVNRRSRFFSYLKRSGLSCLLRLPERAHGYQAHNGCIDSLAIGYVLCTCVLEADFPNGYDCCTPRREVASNHIAGWTQGALSAIKVRHVSLAKLPQEQKRRLGDMSRRKELTGLGVTVVFAQSEIT